MRKKITIDLNIREKKLLLIFLAFLMLFCAYQFVFISSMEKIDHNNKDIDDLNIRVMSLRKLKVNESQYQEQMTVYDDSIQKIKQKFVNQVTDEDNIMFVKSLEDQSGIEVNEINLYEPVGIDNITSTEGSTDVNNDTTTTSQPDQQNEATTSSDDNQQAIVQSLDYNHKLSIKFKSGYDELKKMINYVKEFPYLRTINDLKTAYDSGTGELVGEMTLNVYSMKDALNTYKQPNTGVTDLGVNNLFGTIE